MGRTPVTRRPIRPNPHVLLGEKAGLHRRDSMISRFRVSDSAVSVVVAKLECIRSGRCYVGIGTSLRARFGSEGAALNDHFS